MLLLLLSVTLTAAPCAHCTIQPASDVKAGHDCCPKQKHDSQKAECGWMPAQYVAPEGITPGVELAVAAFAPAVVASAPPAPVSSFSSDEAHPPISPPLYLTNTQLLI